MIVNRFEGNLETSLLEVSSYFPSSAKESQDEIGAVIDIAPQPHWIDPTTGHLHVDESTKKRMAALGFNVVAVVDANLHELFGTFQAK